MKNKYGKSLVSVILVCLCALGMPITAQAYTMSGSHWNGSNLRIRANAIGGNYSTGLNTAISNINSSTHVTLSRTTDTGPSWKASVTNYGNTGWEGESTWSYYLGATHSAESKINTYYIPSGTAPARIKVIWLHELSHVLGLGHVSSVNRVMYTSASAAYTQGGVRNLTSDEVSGINSLY